MVEDDAATRDMLVRALSSEFSVYAAEDAERALSMIQTIPTLDGVVTDVMMPGMDGFELARAIRTLPSAKPIPVMFLTARDAPADIVNGINAGARHYLTKPFKIEVLLEKVRKMVAR